MADIGRFLIPPNASLREAMACIERNLKSIALIVDQQCHLIGTVNDGDIRRAIMPGEDLDVPVSELLPRREGSPYPRPVTAPTGTDRRALLQLMQERSIRQVPLLDDAGIVVDLVTMDELLPVELLPLQAVIMAGGAGTRLRPLTDDLPKPMLPVGDQPLLELTIEQLRQAGIRQVNIATHYKSEKIVNHFSDGHDFGVELNYVTEDRPLGTAGALGLMKTPLEPLLVINGDILTRVDFRAMSAYHQEHNAALTVAVRKYDVKLPYGVVENDGVYVQGLVEKPVLSFFVNAGIYLLEPTVHRHIPNDRHFDMTDLIPLLIDAGQPVVSFPVLEYWLDIGQHGDYLQAQEDVKGEGLAL